MFKITQFLLLIICVPKYLEAAAAIRPCVEKPEELADQEGCYVPEINKVLPYRESAAPIKSGSCLQYTCNDDNTTSIFSCGAIGYDKKAFTFTQDYTQAYPCCCGTLTSKADGKSMNVGGAECK